MIVCPLHQKPKERVYLDASLRKGWVCRECEKVRAAETPYREIQRIAADGIEANPEGSDNWNLFANIHQLACRAMTLPKTTDGASG